MTLPNMNLSQVRSESIGPDAYIMEIKRVEIDTEHNCLICEMDICEGEFAGYYEKLSERWNFWGMKLYLNGVLDPENMEKKDRWRINKTIDALVESNPDFDWDYDGENDEQKMVGKRLGVVTRLKEYWGGDGKERSKLVPYSTISVNDVRLGNYTIPEPIRREKMEFSGEVVDTTGGFGPVKDDEIPF